MIYYFLLIFIILSYFFVSYKKKRLVNILFFHHFFVGGLTVFPYCLHLSMNNSLFVVGKGDLLLFFYYFALTCILIAIELNKPVFHVKNRKNCSPSKSISIVLIAFLILYFIANFGTIREAAINPRMFYASNRIGGGFIYYVVLPVLVFSYLLLVWKTNFRSNSDKALTFFKVLILSILCFGVLYLFGQKSIILTAGLIMIVAVYFKSSEKTRNARLISMGIALLGFMILVFAFYTVQQGMTVNNVFVSISNYADYIPNFCDLVESLSTHFYGKILFEDITYSYIPRVFWPSKPTLYGSLTLGLYVPRLVSWTRALTGAPSFGDIGAEYADFGVFGIVLKLGYNFLIASFGKAYEEKLYKETNFWYFMLFITFSGPHIFYVTLEKFPLYQLLVVLLLYQVSKGGGKVPIFYRSFVKGKVK